MWIFSSRVLSCSGVLVAAMCPTSCGLMFGKKGAVASVSHAST